MLVEKKRGEEKEKRREEKLELGAEGKKRGRRLRGRGSARVSARQRIVRVLHLQCANVGKCILLVDVVHCAVQCLRCGPLTGACSLGLQPNLGEESP